MTVNSGSGGPSFGSRSSLHRRTGSAATAIPEGFSHDASDDPGAAVRAGADDLHDRVHPRGCARADADARGGPPRGGFAPPAQLAAPRAATRLFLPESVRTADAVLRADDPGDH